jgi:hypothetical protein
MPLFELYSTRLKAGHSVDIWAYDAPPEPLRIQIPNIVKGAFGKYRSYPDYNPERSYERIHDAVAREHGKVSLSRGASYEEKVLLTIQSERDLLIWLDVIELTFRIIDRGLRRISADDRTSRGISISAADAVAELNERFRRAGFGYRYESGGIVRMDSEVLPRNQASDRGLGCDPQGRTFIS